MIESSLARSAQEEPLELVECPRHDGEKCPRCDGSGLQLLLLGLLIYRDGLGFVEPSSVFVGACSWVLHEGLPLFGRSCSRSSTCGWCRRHTFLSYSPRRSVSARAFSSSSLLSLYSSHMSLSCSLSGRSVTRFLPFLRRLRSGLLIIPLLMERGFAKYKEFPASVPCAPPAVSR